MICPNCEKNHIDVGADGKVYCLDCMTTIEGAEFVVSADKIIEELDEFIDNVDPEDRLLALELIQCWLYKKAEVF